MDALSVLQVSILCCNVMVNGYIQTSSAFNKIYSLTPVVFVGGEKTPTGNSIRLLYDATSNQDLVIMKNKQVMETMKYDPLKYFMFTPSLDLSITEAGTYSDKLLFVYAESSATVSIRTNVFTRGNRFRIDYNAIPTEESGTEYFAVTFCSHGCISKIAIIWIPEQDNEGYREQDIMVHIQLPTGDNSLEVSIGANRYGAGDTIETVLSTDYVLLIKCNQDLTGTKITSSHNIVVLSGSEAKITETSTVGFMLEHLTPVNRWGKEFIMLALPENSDGDSIICLNYFSNTALNFSDKATGLILKNAGDSYERKIPANSLLHLVSDKPIIVYQFLTGTTTSGDAVDPDMVRVTPVEQYTLGKIVHRIKSENYGFRVIYGYTTTTVKVNNGAPDWKVMKYKDDFFAGIVKITKNMVVEISSPGGGGYEVQRSQTNFNSIALDVGSMNIDLNFITPKHINPEESNTTSQTSTGIESVSTSISTAGTTAFPTSMMYTTSSVDPTSDDQSTIANTESAHNSSFLTTTTAIISNEKSSTVPKVVETTEGTRNTTYGSTESGKTSATEALSSEMTSNPNSTFNLQDMENTTLSKYLSSTANLSDEFSSDVTTTTEKPQVTTLKVTDISTLENPLVTTSAYNSSVYSKYCPCSCTHHDNLTFDELSAIVEALKEELRLNKEILSVTIRRRTSAKDNRVSSTSMGICGALVIMFVPFVIILSDLAGLYTKIANRKDNNK